MNMILIFLLALAISTLMIPLLVRRAGAWQLLDVPDARKQHVGAVPRIGGIAIAVATLASAMVWSLSSPASSGAPPFGFLLGSMVIVYFGLLDDRKDLDYRLKFGGQILGAVLAFAIDVALLQVPFMAAYTLPLYLAFPLTILLLLGATNAFNLLDGLDGLAAGCASLSLAAIMALALVTDGGIDIILLAAAALGGILGFLRHNTHPAVVYMGDAGSQFLGFTIGGLAIILVERSDGQLSPALILPLLGLPVIDTAMVMLLRIKDRRSPFSPDRNHIHHKLLSVGLQHHQAVGVIYVVQAAIVFSAVLLRYQSDLVIISVYGIICGLFMATYVALRRRHARVAASAQPAHGKMPISAPAWPLHRTRLRKLLVGYVGCSVALYLIVGAMTFDAVTVDVASIAIAIGLVGVVMGLGLWQRAPFPAVRLGLYLAVIYVSYLSGGPTAPVWLNTAPFYLWLASVALAVGLIIVLTQGRLFRLSTQDLLVALVILGIVALPLTAIEPPVVSAIVIRAMIFIYASELLIVLTRPKPRMIGVVSLLSLMVLALPHVAPADWQALRDFWHESA